VSYRELVAEAGISRGAIREAIDDAVRGGFITCTSLGRKSGVGHAAQSARYRLRWDSDAQYTKAPAAFAGFYFGEGHRTPIPNAFFDHVVPNEVLAVVKVVGTVLRHTVGYQNQFGGRRSEAPLSYSYLQKYIRVCHRPTLAAAVRNAVRKGYIRRISNGRFDPHGGKASRPAHYAVHWPTDTTSSRCSSKTEPGADQFKNPNRKPSKKPNRKTSSKTEPMERQEQRTLSNNTSLLVTIQWIPKTTRSHFLKRLGYAIRTLHNTTTSQLRCRANIAWYRGKNNFRIPLAPAWERAGWG
jgi:hypothetical protein